MEALAFLIVGRNLGDAVIQSDFMKRLVQSNYAERYVVWTRPQVAFLFEDIPNCEVVTSQFPVGTNKNFGAKQAIAFFKCAWALRRMRPSVTIDLIGDVRERCFARIAGSTRHVHIGWAPDHPFNLIIRNPFGQGKPAVTVPNSIPNVYQAYNLMLSHLTGGKPEQARQPHSDRASMCIGLHPFASQRCKLWPDERWCELAERLLAQGAQITVFGAPSELPALERIFGRVISRVTVFTRSIADFTREVEHLDLFVGLDSFGVHTAHRQGVRSIMINAGNNPAVWTPPSAMLIAHTGGCKHYPCNNVPRCENTPDEYVCIKSVRVEDALSAIARS